MTLPQMNTRPLIGLTMGDPAGVGPELCLRALSSREVLSHGTPVLFGDLDLLKRVSGAAGIPIPANLRVLDQPRETDADAPALVHIPGLDAAAVAPGKVSAACGAAGFEFIKAAIEAAQAGLLSAVVTAPIHKEALHLAGVDYAGHTEIFAALTNSKRSCMMLWSPSLAVSFVTTHIGYAEVPNRLNESRILDVIELTAEALARMHSRPALLGICGLNPHAGERGLFGAREEERFVEPALREARARGIAIDGPLPPDAAFIPDCRKAFDGIVCLYHDQGHIPFKMLSFDDGVNVTLGLPIVRTSVDHGTAFDIAWRGVARPNSLFKAIECAVRLGKLRQP
jgi:4-hydroxythreonine-4-phosphate dehydrogenase